jgi:serine/threonine protein kinase
MSDSHADRPLANSCARAVVKTADVNNKVQRECLLREYNNHRRPRIASSQNFRKIFDTINDHTSWTAQKPFCLALEWMDTTLADISTDSHIENPVLIASILKTVLGGFGELEREHLVYTGMPFAPLGVIIYIPDILSTAGLKPANVLVSDIDGPSLEVKIGDLGLSSMPTHIPTHEWC